MVFVKQWNGRTCNNIIQIFNCIIICKRFNLKFEQILEHELIDRFSIDFSSSHDKPIVDFNILYDAENSNFYRGSIPYFNDFYPFDISNDEYYLILHEYILPHLKLPKDIEKLSDDTLVISIRSGDIIRDNILGSGMLELYNSNNNTILYTVPPAKMYYNIIEKYDKVIIVCENALNPVINHLKNKYGDKVTVQSSSLKEDIITLLSAQSLAGSSLYNGTFFHIISSLSKNAKEIYIFDLSQNNNPKIYNYLSYVRVKLIKTPDNYYNNYSLNNLLTWDNEVYQLDL